MFTFKKMTLFLLPLLLAYGCRNSGKTGLEYDLLQIAGVENGEIMFPAESTDWREFTVNSEHPWRLRAEGLDWAVFIPEGAGTIGPRTVMIAPRTVNEGARRVGFLIAETGNTACRIMVWQEAVPGEEPEPGPDDTSFSVDGHPRLLLTAEDIPEMKKRIQRDPMLLKLHNYIMGIADQTLYKPVNERVLEGIRLLNVSVENMTRIFYCSYAYRMTGDRRYSDRAAAEMLKAASFQDWNPSHFLDVAEMTMGVALGYDWCYPALTEQERADIREGIIRHGLTPGMMENDNTAWQHENTNWNQVCNTGLLYGALAIVEDNPEYAKYLQARAVRSVPLAMEAYNPHGAYPEGPAYWCYGTVYNVLLLALLNDYYGTDFGLLEQYPAFKNTVDYSIAVMTPTLNSYSYMDQSFRAQLSVVPFWFYSMTGDASYLYMQSKILDYRTILDIADCRHQRTLPAALVFGAKASDMPSTIPEPSWLGYAAGGLTPIAVFRSGWDNTTDIYLGFKSGTPNISHGHMDIGSFYLEADGIRWALDLGGENYTKIEGAGVDLWNYSPGSQRWDLLRLGVQGHNCLMFDGGPQNAAEGAGITDYAISGNHMYAVADLSAMYGINGISAVHRAVSLVNGTYAAIQDKITTGSSPATVRWAMCTEATSVTYPDVNRMVLAKSNKKLYMRIDVDPYVDVDTDNWDAIPTASYEIVNSGKQFVGFTAELQPNTTYNFTVYLMPGKDYPTVTPPYTFK